MNSTPQGHARSDAHPLWGPGQMAPLLHTATISAKCRHITSLTEVSGQ